MRLEKRRPRRASTSLRRWLDAIALQHVGNRPTPDFVIKVGQRPLNPRVTPTSIFLRHAYDQLRDLTHDARPSHASALGKVPLLRNQPPMPAQQSIGRDDGVELEQSPSTHGLGLARQKSSFSVGEADSLSAQPILEQSVLSLKEFDNDQLMAMN